MDRAIGATVEALDEPTDEADRVLEGDPWIALTPLLGRGQLDVPVRDMQVPGSTRRRGQSTGRQERVEEGQPERGQDRGGAQVRLDAFDDRGEGHELSGRMQIQQLVHELGRAVHRREAGLDRGADLIGADIGSEPDQVLGVQWRLTDLGLAALVATDGTPVHPGDGLGGRLRRRPHELLGDEHPATGRTAGGVQVAERDLEARLSPRRGRHALERGVEVADIRRPQDDLRQHPRQRVRLETDRPALLVEGGTCHPTASAEQVGDDIAGARVRLDPGGDEPPEGRGEQPIEDRQRRRGLWVRVRRLGPSSVEC